MQGNPSWFGTDRVSGPSRAWKSTAPKNVRGFRVLHFRASFKGAFTGGARMCPLDALPGGRKLWRRLTPTKLYSGQREALPSRKWLHRQIKQWGLSQLSCSAAAWSWQPPLGRRCIARKPSSLSLGFTGFETWKSS